MSRSSAVSETAPLPAAPPHPARGARYLRGGMAAGFVVLVLAMFPYTPQPTYDIKRFIVQIMVFVLVAGWAWHGRRTRTGVGGWTPLRALWLALVLVHVAAWAFSDYPGFSSGAVTWAATLFLLYLVASRAYTAPRQVDALMTAACAAVALSTAYAFLQWRGLDPFPWNPEVLSEEVYRRLPGTFGNPNVAGHALIPVLIFAAYLAFGRGWWWALGLVAVFAVHSYRTGHRAGIAALVAALAAVGLAMLLRRIGTTPTRSVAAFLLALALPAALVVAAAGIAPVRERLPVDGSLILRYNSFHGAARMAMDRPLLGFGPGTFVIENVPYWTALEQEHFARTRRLNDHPHSEPLDMAVGAGPAAGALYLCLLLAPLLMAAHRAVAETDPQRRRLALALLAFFTAFLVDGAFGFNLRAPVTGVLLALMLGAFEGVYGRRPDPLEAPEGPGRAIPAVAATVVAFLCLSLGVRAFAAQVYQQRGAAALHHGAYDIALDNLARGAALAPWDWMFEARAGQALLAKGDPAGALERFNRSLERHPYYPPALIQAARAGLALAAAGDAEGLKAAQDYTDRALRLCPGLYQAHADAGRVALLRAMRLPGPARQPFLDSADQAFARALAEGADNRAELHALRAQVALLKGAPEEAEGYYVRAVAADEGLDSIWDAFTTFAEQTRRFDGLRSSVEAAVDRLRTRGQDQPPPALAAAYAASRGTAEDLDRAARTLAAALPSPERPEARARVRSTLGWAIRLAWAEAQRPPLADQASARTLRLLGLALYQAGALEESVRAFSRAEAKAVDPGEVVAGAQGKAQALEELGRYHEAEAALAKALAVQPGNGDVRFARMRVRAKSGDTAGARREGMALLEDPGLDPALRRAVEAYHRSLQQGPQ